MNKNLIADIFSYIGWFACTAFTGWGLLYVLKGNIVLAAAIAIITIVALIFLVSYMVKYKTAKLVYPNMMPEYALGIAYSLLAFSLFSFQFHAISVDFFRKDALKKVGIDKANTIRDLQITYDSMGKAKINSFVVKVDTYLGYYKNASRGDQSLIVYKDSLVKLLGVNDELYASYERSNMQEEAKAELEKSINESKQAKVKIMQTSFLLGTSAQDAEQCRIDAETAFKNWEMQKVSFHYYNIEAERDTLYKVTKSKMPDFVYKAPANNETINLDSSTDSLKNSSFGSIILVFLFILVVHGCILAPYLVADRPKTSRLIRRKTKGEKIEGDISDRF
jgi:hypothetical protein